MMAAVNWTARGSPFCCLGLSEESAQSVRENHYLEVPLAAAEGVGDKGPARCFCRRLGSRFFARRAGGGLFGMQAIDFHAQLKFLGKARFFSSGVISFARGP